MNSTSTPEPARSRQISRFAAGAVTVFFLFVLILLALKTVFAVSIWPALKPAGAALIIKGLVHGLRFEMVTAGYASIPALVLLYLAGLTGQRWWPRLLLGYLLAVTGLIGLICLADVQYFEEAGKHLTYEATQYLDASILPVLQGAFQLHPWLSTLSLLAWAGALPVLWRLWRRVLRLALPEGGRRMSLFTLGLLPVWIALLVLATRGGAQSRPVRIAESAITLDPYVNALCLDPVFAVLITMTKSSGQEFHFYNVAENTRTVRGLVMGGDAPAPERPEFPLVRASAGTPAGNRRNVVLVILESWSGKDVGVLGGTNGATPVFDALAREGALFDRFHSMGIRTPEGIFSILCSFPNQPLRPIMMRPVVDRVQWRSLSAILSEAGYESLFVHGGALSFDHMDGVLRMIGFQRLIDRREFPKSTRANTGPWLGHHDEEVMRRANREFAGRKGRPFLGVIYTMNTHPPFVTPPDHPLRFPAEQRYLNSLSYSDHALRTYFDAARREDYFTNTVFVLVADHARTHDRFTVGNQHRIPFLIYAPGHVKPATHHIVGGQLDILPTVLGLLELKTLHASWGQDLLHTPEERGFALSVVGNEVRWHDGRHVLCDGLGSKPPRLFAPGLDPTCTNDLWLAQPRVGGELQRKLRAVVSLSQTHLFHDRVFPRTRLRANPP